jgi:lysophospholipase L1-like esterase
VKAQYGAGDGIHLNDSGHALVAEQVMASPAWKAVCPALR